MNRFVCNSLIFITGLLLILAFIFGIFLISNKDMSNFLAAHIDKMSILANAGYDKIVFIGGSNLAFGLDSKAIELEFHRKVVNCGLHVGLGIKFMMSDVLPFIGKGDKVIIIPEYEHFVSKGFMDGENEALAEMLLKYDFEGMKCLDTRQIINVMVNAPGVMRETFINEVFLHKKAKNFPNNVYVRDFFNEYGDMVGHLDQPSLAIQAPRQWSATGSPSDAITSINDFALNVTKREARCLFAFPCLREEDFELNRSLITSLERELRALLTIPILGTASDFRFSKELFFNTNYHLNGRGRALRTERLIALMRESSDFM